MTETREQWIYPRCFDCHEDHGHDAKLEKQTQYRSDKNKRPETIYVCPRRGEQYKLRMEKRYMVRRLDD